jgi:hypothetical protein
MLVLKDPLIRYRKNQEFPLRFMGDGVSPVKPHDKVNPSTVVFEGMATNILQSIDLNKELSLSTKKKVKKFLLKSEGEIVEEGDVLAKRSVSFGIAERIVKSKYEGKVSCNRIDQGVVDIMAPSIESVVTADMYGRVAHIMPSAGKIYKEIVLSVDGLEFRPELFGGGDVSGHLHLLKEGNSIYRPSDVDDNCKQKIVVAGRLLNLKLYEALVSAGALGVIVGGVGYEDYDIIKQKAIPIAVTEGWGAIPINDILMNILQKYNGTPVYIDRSNNLLFIYPKGDFFEFSSLEEKGELKYMSSEKAGELVDLEIGHKVQIWDAPFWGYVGNVIDILESENLVNVELSNGRKALLEPELVQVVINE